MIIAKKRADASFDAPRSFVVLTLLLFVCLGVAESFRIKPKFNRSHFSNHVQDSAILQIQILEKLKKHAFYESYLGKIISVDRVSTEGKVLLRFMNIDSSNCIELDNLIFTKMPLTRIPKPRNPGDFNFREFAKRRGLYFQIDLRKHQFFKRELHQFYLKTAALRTRDRIAHSLRNREISSEVLMIMEALLLGDKRNLDQTLRELYKNAGAMHILAISGLHIGVVVLILQFILKPLARIKNGQIIRLVLIVLCLWTFAFISGLSPSVIRAVSMFSILSIAIVFERSTKLNNYLFLSLFISLLFQPLYIFDVGFQMSYVAIVSIMTIGTTLKNLWKPKHKIIAYLWNLSVVSLSAQLGLLPLSLYYFHHFSGMFLLSSLLVIPILGLLLGGGYVIIFLDQLHIQEKSMTYSYFKLVELMNFMIQFVGKFDNFIFSQVYFDAILLVLTYTIIFILLKWLRKRSWDNFLLILLFCLIFQNYLTMNRKTGLQRASFTVFHKNKSSLFMTRSGNKLITHADFKADSLEIVKSIENYRIDHLGLDWNEKNEIRHFYRYKTKRIMVIDHATMDSDFGFNPDILILVDSPKINLERLLQTLNPSTIVADGSNYSSFKSLWQKTASSRGVKFHDTTKDGAFILY